jgi:hypothetical protein
MIILNQTTDTIKIKLESSTTINPFKCYASFRDSDDSSFLPKNNGVWISNTSDTVLIGAPASNFSRGVDYMSIFNDDTVSNTVAVILDLNGTQYQLAKVILLSKEKLEYTDLGGFVVKTAKGETKVDNYTSISPSSSILNKTVITSDVSNATQTLADVTGLSFPVKAKRLYWFSFFVRYTSTVSTNGALFTINGPAFNYLMYNSAYSNATNNANTTNTNLIAYNSGTTSANTGNIAMGGGTIVGLIEPSADGTVIARFRNELASNTITTIAGSFVRWRELYKYT